ncbi:MAG: hypothetical protein HQK61_05940 [Desulfamplus sp.]|nr:hypothetical protein [Desulfamplus sp.]
MSPYFDIRTLSFATGIIAVTLGICMLFVVTSQKGYPGFTKWTVGSALNGVGMLMLGLRGFLPDFLTVVVANFFIIVFFILVARGLIEFAGFKQTIWVCITPVIILMTTFLYFTYHSPDVSARVVIISLLIASLCWRSAYIVHRHVPLIIAGSNWLLTGIFSFAGAWFFVRAIFTVLFENNIQSFMSAGILHGLTFVVVFVSNIFVVIGLIIINSRRLEQDLTNAKKEIKSLAGLIPICSNCKKVRDDKGYWQQVEVYIRDHSDADFTHGICSDCIKKLYPDFV